MDLKIKETSNHNNQMARKSNLTLILIHNLNRRGEQVDENLKTRINVCTMYYKNNTKIKS